MLKVLRKHEGILKSEHGPGESPARLTFMSYLIGAFLLVQTAPAAGFQGFTIYSAPSSKADEAGGGASRDSRNFDSKRAVERFQQRSAQEKGLRKRAEEQKQDAQQTQEVERGVTHEKQISQAISQQEVREADSIYSRTTGIDNYSVDIDGGVWRSHVGLLAEAWNIASKDLYGNESRSRMTQFEYNDLFNATGFHRRTVDNAGRVTETVVSGIAYQDGETARNFLRGNKEANRTEITTTYHPTGNRVVKTELFGMEYEGGEEGKLLSQKAKITELSGPDPGHATLQEVYGMQYDGDNLVQSETRVTDLETGMVTESITKNTFSGNRLTSGITESTTKDFINYTHTQQVATQEITYDDGRIRTILSKDVSTTKAMDEAGSVLDDFVTVVETTREMGDFAGIPEPVAIVSVIKTIDNVGVQVTEGTRQEKHIRDKHGNLLEVSASESSTTTNFDGSVVQDTASEMYFRVIADQAHLTGRVERSLTKDLIGGQNVVTTSRLKVEMDDNGKILGGKRLGKSYATNGDGSIITESEFTQTFDGAEKVNALALVRQETHTRTTNRVNESLTSRDVLHEFSSRRHWGDYRMVRTFEESVTEEDRFFTQAHDGVGRVLSAEETVKSRTTTTRGGDQVGETLVEGTITYAVGKRTNQAYAVEARNQITTKDPFSLLYTESTQVSTFKSDADTGRAIQGLRTTDSVSRRMMPEGDVIEGTLVILGHSEEHLVGLEKANGFGTTLRVTNTEVRDLLQNQVTDQREVYTQQLDAVGKIESAEGVTRSLTQDIRRTGAFKTESVTRTAYQTVLGNSTVPVATKTAEVTVSDIDGSYRIVAREDVTRYDAYGRILPINEKDQEKSGYLIWLHRDSTVQPVPADPLTPDELFEQFFGTGLTP
ncbi:MAG: hypothetical protein ABH845_04480 [Candidatus Omnitrophota bacterium]